ncbi:DUF2255 family protein [soil metagenome]
MDEATELEIAVRRADGTLHRQVPIWVVRVGEQVFVRSWYRRDTGWFGRAVASGRARIQVPGLESDVSVEDLGGASTDLLDEVDSAYRAKYGPGGSGSMVSDDARATTLRLSRG